MTAWDDSEIALQLADYLAKSLVADHVRITQINPLTGGAIQENWLLDVEIAGGVYAGNQEWVLRSDAPAAVSDSHTRSQEFALLRAAQLAGVKVPSPILLGDPAEFGREFFIMSRAAGTANGVSITKKFATPELTWELGAELAKIHSITPPVAELDFLSVPTSSPVQSFVRESRDYLASHPQPFPVLELGLNWLDENEPPANPLTLVHRDFRTGNYLVEANSLTGILDWEFSGWSDPLEDIGWFTAACWRFSRPDLIAGGVGSLENFLAGYQSQSDLSISESELHYWQVLAHLRWALIAIKQSHRHLSGEQPSLELALTGHLVPGLELQILKMIGISYPLQLLSAEKNNESDLLSVASAALKAELLPRLPTSSTYQALMINNSLQITLRQQTYSTALSALEVAGLKKIFPDSLTITNPEITAENRRLSQVIRDRSNALELTLIQQHLWDVTVAKCQISTPKALN